MVEFDHLISKEKVEEDDKIEDIVQPNSRIEYPVVAEGVVRNLPAGTLF